MYYYSGGLSGCSTCGAEIYQKHFTEKIFFQQTKKKHTPRRRPGFILVPVGDYNRQAQSSYANWHTVLGAQCRGRRVRSNTASYIAAVRLIMATPEADFRGFLPKSANHPFRPISARFFLYCSRHGTTNDLRLRRRDPLHSRARAVPREVPKIEI